jgi:hypothetical protein
MAANVGSTVVEHSSRHLKVEGLSPAPKASTGREQMEKNLEFVVES